jgi:hypothetical protein
MAAPTFVSWAAATWSANTSPKTLNVSVNSGDIMVVNAASEGPPTILGVSGGGLVYTLQQSYQGISSTPNAYVWTATASSTTTVTVSLANTGSTQQWGFEVYVFRNASVGASGKSQVTGTTASASLTTTAANSAIVLMSADWNAVSAATRTWATINSITPTSGNTLEKVATATGNYTIFSAYWSDAGSAGAKTPGVTAAASMKPSVVAVEIKGSGGLSASLGSASEVDTANALTRQKRRTTTTPSTPQTANALTRQKRRTAGSPTQPSISAAITRQKRRTLGFATEVDTAFSVTPTGPVPKFAFLGVATESDTALSVDAQLTESTALYYFTTPSMAMYPAPRDRLWRYFPVDRGISVMVRDGVASEVIWPEEDDFELFDYVYLGGRTYTITAAEAATLRAAGYSENITGV